jgi:hypothetical protein
MMLKNFIIAALIVGAMGTGIVVIMQENSRAAQVRAERKEQEARVQKQRDAELYAAAAEEREAKDREFLAATDEQLHAVADSCRSAITNDIGDGWIVSFPRVDPYQSSAIHSFTSDDAQMAGNLIAAAPAYDADAYVFDALKWLQGEGRSSLQHKFVVRATHPSPNGPGTVLSTYNCHTHGLAVTDVREDIAY